MSDIFTRVQRSRVMSLVRSRGNKALELALATLLREHSITGWRRHQPVFGRPDFIFRSVRLAIFVDGCFWHGCVKHSSIPASHEDFWQKKLLANKRRDKLVNRTLRARGWRVLRLWGHDLSHGNRLNLLRRLRRAITSHS